MIPFIVYFLVPPVLYSLEASFSTCLMLLVTMYASCHPCLRINEDTIQYSLCLNLSQVSLFASVLLKHGIGYGDRVLIYMPMIPEAIVVMLACARIGAIHSLVFGGFAAKELGARIAHAEVGCASLQVHAVGFIRTSFLAGASSTSKA